LISSPVELDEPSLSLELDELSSVEEVSLSPAEVPELPKFVAVPEVDELDDPEEADDPDEVDDPDALMLVETWVVDALVAPSSPLQATTSARATEMSRLCGSLRID